MNTQLISRCTIFFLLKIAASEASGGCEYGSMERKEWFSYFPACNTDCNCFQRKNLVYVDCSNKGLSFVPSGLPINTDILYLQGNDIQSISNRSFVDAINSSTNNDVSSCNQNAFQLRELYLHNNVLLTKIADGAFTHFPNIKTLLVHHTSLKELRNGLFSGLEASLTILWAHNTHIKSIEDNTFVELTKLKQLWLHNTHVERFQGHIFSNLKNLEELKLHHEEHTDGFSNVSCCSFCGVKKNTRLFADLDDKFQGSLSCGCNSGGSQDQCDGCFQTCQKWAYDDSITAWKEHKQLISRAYSSPSTSVLLILACVAVHSLISMTQPRLY